MSFKTHYFYLGCYWTSCVDRIENFLSPLHAHCSDVVPSARIEATHNILFVQGTRWLLHLWRVETAY